MFVIIVVSIGYQPFSLFVTNIKKNRELHLFMWRLWTAYATNKKAHDLIVGVSPFLRSDSKLSRFWLSEEKRKRFDIMDVNNGVVLLYRHWFW